MPDNYTARDWLEIGLSFVFPSCCELCDVALRLESMHPAICQSCEQKIMDSHQSGCPRCGAFLARNELEGRCVACRHENLSFDGVVSLGRYEASLREAILHTKTDRGQALAFALGCRLASQLECTGRTEQIDLATCIPKHWTKRLRTSVNGPEVIMSGLANRLNLPAAANLLVCRRKITKQAMLSPDQRRRNVKDAWKLSHQFDISGARVLLVDDTMTTGATANAASRALKMAGASEVTVAVLGRAQKMK